MAWRHRDILEAELHEPKGFTTANNGDDIWRNEVGASEWADREVLPAGLDFVDASVAPPTTSNGDIYVLSLGGSVHANWGSVALKDWVRYDGTDWNAITPSKSIICYDKTSDLLNLFDGSVWSSIGSSIYSADDTIGIGRVATLTDTLTFDGGQVNINGAGTTIATSALLVKNGSGEETLKVLDNGDVYFGELFQGVPKNRIIGFQPDDTGNNTFLEVYQGNATGASGLQFSMGMDTFNPFIKSKANLNIISGTMKIAMASSAQRIEFLAGATIYASFDNNSDSYINAVGQDFGIGLTNPNSKLHVKGSGGLIVFKAQSNAGADLFEVKDNGDIFTETLQGLNVTLDPTAITSMTFTNGILTAQS